MTRQTLVSDKALEAWEALQLSDDSEKTTICEAMAATLRASLESMSQSEWFLCNESYWTGQVSVECSESFRGLRRLAVLGAVRGSRVPAATASSMSLLAGRVEDDAVAEDIDRGLVWWLSECLRGRVASRRRQDLTEFLARVDTGDSAFPKLPGNWPAQLVPDELPDAPAFLLLEEAMNTLSDSERPGAEAMLRAVHAELEAWRRSAERGDAEPAVEFSDADAVAVARGPEVREAVEPSQVEKAMVERVKALAAAGLHDEARVAWNEVDRRFRDSSESPLSRLVAQALASKLLMLGELGRHEEALATCDQVDRCFGHLSESELRVEVPRALWDKSSWLRDLDRPKQTLAVLDDVVQGFGGHSDDWLQSFHLAQGVFKRDMPPPDPCRLEEAVAALSDVVCRFADDTEVLHRRLVPEALLSKGRSFVGPHRYEEAISAFDKAIVVAADFADAHERSLLDSAVVDFLAKGGALPDIGHLRKSPAAPDLATQGVEVSAEVRLRPRPPRESPEASGLVPAPRPLGHRAGMGARSAHGTLIHEPALTLNRRAMVAETHLAAQYLERLQGQSLPKRRTANSGGTSSSETGFEGKLKPCLAMTMVKVGVEQPGLGLMDLWLVWVGPELYVGIPDGEAGQANEVLWLESDGASRKLEPDASSSERVALPQIPGFRWLCAGPRKGLDAVLNNPGWHLASGQTAPSDDGDEAAARCLEAIDFAEQGNWPMFLECVAATRQKAPPEYLQEHIRQCTLALAHDLLWPEYGARILNEDLLGELLNIPWYAEVALELAKASVAPSGPTPIR